MRILDPLVRSRPSRGDESRYSFSDFVSWVTTSGARFPVGAVGADATGVSYTWGKQPVEQVAEHFAGYVEGIYKTNGVVAAVEFVRLLLFSEARFQYQRMRSGRPGDLFGDAALARLERPWEGGTTGDLLARVLVDADFAGNSYTVDLGGEFVRLRPDWVDVVMAPRMHGDQLVGLKRIAYAYYEGGKQARKEPAVFLPHQVAHFAPLPDPLANYRGMSWLTPVVREVMADGAATKHKLKFFENAATPNLAVSMAKEVTPEQFDAFVDAMEKHHKGAQNAYKTLYTGGGADVTVIGADMKQLDFKLTQGAGETRIAAAAGVPPVIVGLSEGLQSATYSNYGQARRRFADGTMHPLWRNVAGSFETLVRPPADARLWVDTRDIPFLREDESDIANIQQTQANAIRSLTDAGYEPTSVVQAILNDDLSRLVHTGLYSVQLSPAGAEAPPAAPAA